MMKNNIILNYMLKKGVKMFLLLLIMVYVIVFFCDCSEVMRKCSNNEIAYSIDFLAISLNRSFLVIVDVMQYILLLSNTIVFSRINQTEELTILKTNGFTIFQLMKQYTFFSFWVGVFNVFVIYPFALESSKNASKMESFYLDHKIEKQEDAVHSNIWVEQKRNDDDILIYINKLVGNKVTSVNIYYFNKDTTLSRHIFAHSAEVTDSGFWKLKNGMEKKEGFKQVLFDEKNWETNLKISDLANYDLSPARLDIFSLIDIFSIRKQLGIPSYAYEFYINFLIMKILIMIIVSLFSILFCYEHHRYAVRWINILFVLLFAFGLNFVLNTIKSIGVSREISPIITCWFPTIMMFVAVIFGMYKVQKHY